jgi:hypothetical protein
LIPNRGKKFFFFAPCPNGLGTIQPSIQWVPEVRQLEREADHSRPSAARIMNAFKYTATTPHTHLWLHLDGFTTHLPFQQYSLLYGHYIVGWLCTGTVQIPSVITMGKYFSFFFTY